MVTRESAEEQRATIYDRQIAIIRESNDLLLFIHDKNYDVADDTRRYVMPPGGEEEEEDW